MAKSKKQTVFFGNNRVKAKVKQLKDIDNGTRFRTVDNNGEVSIRSYTRKEYDRSLKQYEAQVNEKDKPRRLFKGTQKITTDFNY